MNERDLSLDLLTIDKIEKVVLTVNGNECENVIVNGLTNYPFNLKDVCSHAIQRAIDAEIKLYMLEKCIREMESDIKKWIEKTVKYRG